MGPDIIERSALETGPAGPMGEVEILDMVQVVALMLVVGQAIKITVFVTVPFMSVTDTSTVVPVTVAMDARVKLSLSTSVAVVVSAAEIVLPGSSALDAGVAVPVLELVASLAVTAESPVAPDDAPVSTANTIGVASRECFAIGPGISSPESVDGSTVEALIVSSTIMSGS